jgi:hypothetical protein
MQPQQYTLDIEAPYEPKADPVDVAVSLAKTNRTSHEAIEFLNRQYAAAETRNVAEFEQAKRQVEATRKRGTFVPLPTYRPSSSMRTAEKAIARIKGSLGTY